MCKMPISKGTYANVQIRFVKLFLPRPSRRLSRRISTNSHEKMAASKSAFGGLLFIALVKGPIVGSER
jgi:hypothetical protein